MYWNAQLVHGLRNVESCHAWGGKSLYTEIKPRFILKQLMATNRQTRQVASHSLVGTGNQRLRLKA